LQRLSPAAEGAIAIAEAPLTGRQVEILRLIAAGLNDRDIAVKLVVSEHTVHRHVANILDRLALPSRAAAVAEASRLGLL
jgi:LuxR family maltose regulon positive regulatory protein